MSKNHLKGPILYFLSFSALLLCNFSCEDHVPQQQPDITPVPVVNERLLLSTTMAIPAITSIEYDGQKRPTKYIAGINTVNITYTPNLATYSRFSNGKLFQEDAYTLSNGIAEKVVTKQFDQNGNVTNESVSNYTYTKGKLTHESLMKNGVTLSTQDYFYDSEGNLEHTELYNGAAILIGKSSFTYYNIPDKSGSYGQFDVNMTGTLFPRKAKFLIKEAKSSTKVFENFYDLDAQGYVVKGTLNENGSKVQEYVNTWQ